MYRDAIWKIREDADAPEIEKANNLAKYVLSLGDASPAIKQGSEVTGGLEDEPNETRHINVNSLAEMERLFSGIRLDQIDPYFEVNEDAPIFLALYLALTQKKGIDYSRLHGSLQNDPLSELLFSGSFTKAAESYLRLSCDAIEFVVTNLPNFVPICVTGYALKELGADSVQEVAYSFSNAVVYCEELQRRGLDLLPRLRFHFGCGRDIFEEIAKFRAARKVWSHIAAERFHCSPESSAMEFYSGGSAGEFYSIEPVNNVIRSTFQVLAAVLGGAESITIPTYSQTPLSSKDSIELSLRTQQIVAHESGISRTVDPCGGSYYLESLTEELEKRIEEKIRKIETEWGGMVQAISEGLPQMELTEQFRLRRDQIRTGARVVVAQNKYEIDSGERVRAVRAINTTPKKKTRSVRHMSPELEGKLRQSVLNRQENVMQLLIEVAKSGATVAEIRKAITENNTQTDAIV